MARYFNEDELAHFGIPGMKWGVRRYQNEDGSLTAAGKNKYTNSGRGRLAKLGKNSKYNYAMRKATKEYSDGRAAAVTAVKEYKNSKKRVQLGAGAITGAIGAVLAGPIGAAAGAAGGAAISSVYASHHAANRLNKMIDADLEGTNTKFGKRVIDNTVKLANREAEMYSKMIKN